MAPEGTAAWCRICQASLGVKLCRPAFLVAGQGKGQCLLGMTQIDAHLMWWKVQHPPRRVVAPDWCAVRVGGICWSWCDVAVPRCNGVTMVVTGADATIFTSEDFALAAADASLAGLPAPPASWVGAQGLARDAQRWQLISSSGGMAVSAGNCLFPTPHQQEFSHLSLQV